MTQIDLQRRELQRRNEPYKVPDYEKLFRHEPEVPQRYDEEEEKEAKYNIEGFHNSSGKWVVLCSVSKEDAHTVGRFLQCREQVAAVKGLINYDHFSVVRVVEQDTRMVTFTTYLGGVKHG